MRALTPGEIGAALLFITAGEAIIFGLILLAILSTARDAVQEDRRKARAWASREAERRAHRRLREILSSIRITAPVELVNESDIDWGEGKEKAHDSNHETLAA